MPTAEPGDAAPPRVIVVDLDLTLFEPGHDIHPDTVTALQSRAAAGASVIVATGRPLAVADHYGRLVGACASVALAGGVVRSPSSNSEPAATAPALTEEDIRAIISCARRAGAPVYLHTVEAWHPIDASQFEIAEHARRVGTAHATGGWDPNTVLLAEIVAPAVPLLDLAHALPSHAAWTVGNDGRYLSLDVQPPSVSKAVGVERVLDGLGYRWSDVLVFGDGENDVPLASKARLSVLVGTLAELAAVSDYRVSLRPSEGAVGAALSVIYDGAPAADILLPLLRGGRREHS